MCLSWKVVSTRSVRWSYTGNCKPPAAKPRCFRALWSSSIQRCGSSLRSYSPASMRADLKCQGKEFRQPFLQVLLQAAGRSYLEALLPHTQHGKCLRRAGTRSARCRSIVGTTPHVLCQTSSLQAAFATVVSLLERICSTMYASVSRQLRRRPWTRSSGCFSNMDTRLYLTLAKVEPLWRAA